MDAAFAPGPGGREGRGDAGRRAAWGGIGVTGVSLGRRHPHSHSATLSQETATATGHTAGSSWRAAEAKAGTQERVCVIVCVSGLSRGRGVLEENSFHRSLRTLWPNPQLLNTCHIQSLFSLQCVLESGVQSF